MEWHISLDIFGVIGAFIPLINPTFTIFTDYSNADFFKLLPDAILMTIAVIMNLLSICFEPENLSKIRDRLVLVFPEGLIIIYLISRYSAAVSYIYFFENSQNAKMYSNVGWTIEDKLLDDYWLICILVVIALIAGIILRVEKKESTPKADANHA